MNEECSCNSELRKERENKKKERKRKAIPSFGKEEAFSPSLNQLLFPSLEHFHFVLHNNNNHMNVVQVCDHFIHTNYMNVYILIFGPEKKQLTTCVSPFLAFSPYKNNMKRSLFLVLFYSHSATTKVLPSFSPPFFLLLKK